MPTAVETPEPPEKDLELPPRAKPVNAMSECPPFPGLYSEELADPEVAAEKVIKAYVDGMHAYDVCEAKRKALIDWINEEGL